MTDDGRRGDGCRLATGFVGGWLLGCRNSAKTASKILKLASEAAQTVRIFEATQISASQESAPLLQSQQEPMHTPRLAIQGGRDRVAARELDEPSALRWIAVRKG